jgi:hypothetical protein
MRSTARAAVKPAVPKAIASNGVEAFGHGHHPVGGHARELRIPTVVCDADVIAGRDDGIAGFETRIA